jgi:hypothetical protein
MAEYAPILRNIRIRICGARSMQATLSAERVPTLLADSRGALARIARDSGSGFARGV